MDKDSLCLPTQLAGLRFQKLKPMMELAEETERRAHGPPDTFYYVREDRCNRAGIGDPRTELRAALVDVKSRILRNLREMDRC